MNCSVLIVDDDKQARENISEYLKLSGYEIFEADSITEAKENISKNDPDIIVLDEQLPDGYGLDLLNALSKMPNRIPVIMITGYGNIEMAVEAMKIGAHDFLTKPIKNLESLERSIKRAAEIVQI